MTMPPRLSVVIVTYRSEKHIGPCLDTLSAGNDIRDGLEILVVDNEKEGAEERARVLEKKYSELRLKCIPNTCNGGYGQGNNLGIRHAGAPVVLIMNPDVRLAGTTPGRICRAFERDDRLALLGMRQFLGNGKKGRSFLWASGLPAGFWGSSLMWLSNRIGFFLPRWECIQGSCFALRKSLFEKAGMFDEQVFMYGEERDIHHRIRALGGTRIACDWSMSYQHLTDIRKPDLKASEKQWNVAAGWCEKHGIGSRRYWLAQRSHLKTVLAVARLRSMGRTTKSIRNLEAQLELIAHHFVGKGP